MLRSSLFTASAFALVAGANAQTPQTLDAEPIPGAVKNAGTYHIATGTWTRAGGQVANFGVTPDVFYSNTAPSGYFTSASGPTSTLGNGPVIDSGVLPSELNTNIPAGSVNPNEMRRDCYRLESFQFGYCDTSTAGGPTAGWDIDFYEAYANCTDPADMGNVLTATVQLTGLPSSGACWFVTIDLTGAEIDLIAEGEGSFDDDVALDGFGWGLNYRGDGTAAAGPLIAGDPVNTDQSWPTVSGLPEDASNTYYGQQLDLCNGTGTGFQNDDSWRYQDMDPNATSSGCYFFGGYLNNNGCASSTSTPLGSFYMEMYGDGDCGVGGFGEIYCNSNPNSTGATASMILTGSEVGLDDDCTLNCFDMEPNSFGFFITSQTPANIANPGIPPSNGILCMTGNIGRFSAAGQIKPTGANGEISLSSSAGEWSTLSIPLSQMGASYPANAGVTTHFQCWYREGGTSNFSDGIRHTWL